ncbi:MAG: UDP-N-acetylglucosamine 2-epimerase (non-hydrolyzing) [Planctomycetia bacterium]
MATKRLACIVGARPNFMKMAPLLRAFAKHDNLEPVLIHTGQHYDRNLSDVFFEELEMPRPDVSLEVGSGKHGAQTARVIERFEEVLESAEEEGKPFSRVIVVGDVNSTMATTIAAIKMQIPVAHVEAGLRSFDRTMPEELNRLITDAVADMLLVSEPDGIKNLKAEGQPDEKIHLVGNVMIDTLMSLLPKAQKRDALKNVDVTPGEYGLVTLHRPANVDSPETLGPMLDVLLDTAKKVKLVFPIHPRTMARIESFGFNKKIEEVHGLILLEPQGYLDFLAFSSQAKVIVTDSGGLQEESTVLGIPCLTARPNTERPITVTQGTSTLVGSDATKLQKHLDEVLDGTYKQGTCPELWDGHASERIAQILADE